MRTSILFFAFAIFALAANAQTTERFLIDDFTVNQGQQVLITLDRTVTEGGAKVVQGNTFTTGSCNGLIGCSRAMRIEVLLGDVSRLFTSQIFPSTTFNFTGEWDISNPKGGKSVSYNQYDGSSTDFVNVNTNGLGGIDFTEGGLAIGVRFAIISDLPSVFTVSLYDQSGGICEGQASFITRTDQDYTQEQITVDILFNSFTGGCAKTNIGAVEIEIPSQDAVDAIVYQIRGVGFPNPSASPAPSVSSSPSQGPSQSNTPAPSASSTPGPSQSRSPAASNSNTPSGTPAPSQSRTPAPSQSQTPAPSSTPSATPSNSGPCIIICTCPEFTCVILYETSIGGVNDIDFDFIPGQSVQDDSSDDGTIIYVTRSDTTVTVTVPTVSVPTVSVPTVSVPSVDIPSVGGVSQASSSAMLLASFALLAFSFMI